MLITQEVIVLYVRCKYAHVVLQLPTFRRRRLQKNEFAVDQDKNGCRGHILRRIAVSYVAIQFRHTRCFGEREMERHAAPTHLVVWQDPTDCPDTGRRSDYSVKGYLANLY